MLQVSSAASGAIQFVALGVLGAGVTILNAWIKEAVSKSSALKELKTNPYCFEGAELIEFRDAANRVILSNCVIESFEYGTIVLHSKDEQRRIVLTCREYKAGYAIYNA